MTVETVKQISEMAKKLADQKAAGLLPSEADRQRLTALIDAEEAEMKTAEAERAARARAQEQARMLQREIDEARLDIKAAAGGVLRAMESFISREFCLIPSSRGLASEWLESVEKALAEQRRVIDAIASRAAERQSRQ